MRINKIYRIYIYIYIYIYLYMYTASTKDITKYKTSSCIIKFYHCIFLVFLKITCLYAVAYISYTINKSL